MKDSPTVGAVPDVFSSLRPLMQARGVRVPADEFHRAVNLAFHASEATLYDRVHAAMWQSLPSQIDRLTGDLDRGGHLRQDGLTLLDIGSGTGLGTELLLRSSLRERIREIWLCDTSEEMMNHARERARLWPVPVQCVVGTIDNVPRREFDLVLTCSVLHHIPVLDTFLIGISQRQGSGGVFMHLQDPNADSPHPERHAGRIARLRRVSLVRRIYNRVRSTLGRDDAYLTAVSQRLLEQGIITSQMTPGEIWSVTDIHVAGLPYSIGHGISMHMIGTVLSGYRPTAHRSYGFFGTLESELPKSLRNEERDLQNAGALDGEWLAGAWLRG